MLRIFCVWMIVLCGGLPLRGLCAETPPGDEAAATDGGVGEEGAAPAKKPAKPQSPPQPKKPEYEKMPYPQLLQKADRGDLSAQFELASRYNYGRDLPKNTREALTWLRRAAQAGSIDAQRLLAVKLFEGHDVTPDHAEAFRWAQKLAEAGDRPGQLMLGRMYGNGEGTNRDLVRAYMWLAIASTPVTGKPLDDLAQHAFEGAVAERDKVAALLLPEQEVEAQQLASDWWLAHQAPATKKNVTTKKKKPASRAANPAANS